MSAAGKASAARDEVPPLGWHVIAGEDLLAALRRVEDYGESADLVYAELWANADHEPKG